MSAVNRVTWAAAASLTHPTWPSPGMLAGAQEHRNCPIARFASFRFVFNSDKSTKQKTCTTLVSAAVLRFQQVRDTTTNLYHFRSSSYRGTCFRALPWNRAHNDRETHRATISPTHLATSAFGGPETLASASFARQMYFSTCNMQRDLPG